MGACVPCVLLSCASSEDVENEDTFRWIQIQEKWRKGEEIVRFWLYIREILSEDFKSPSNSPLSPQGSIDFSVEAFLNSFACYI